MQKYFGQLTVAVAFSLSATSFALAQEAPAPAADPKKDEVLKLQPFELTSSSDVGYGAQTASSSSRLNLRYIDVPQTVGVLTQEFLNDAYVFDSQEMTKLVPGVQARANAHQPGTFYIRGLQITNTYVDGYIAPRAVNRDRALYDRIEYVKGPASAAMGRGEAGGLVNYISKVPTTRERDSVETTIGTDSFYRFEADHNGLITSDGRMAYRVPFYFQDSDNPRGGALMHDRRYGVGPSFRWSPNNKTSINVITSYAYAQSPGPVGEAYWQNNEQFRVQVALAQINPAINWNPYRGDAYIPDDRVFGWKGRGREARTATGTAFLTHKFTDELSFRQGISYTHIDEEYRRFALSPTALPNAARPGDYLVGISYMHEFRILESTRIQGDLLYEKKLWNTKNQFLIGYDKVWGRSDTLSAQRGGLSQSLYFPDYSIPAGFNPDTYITSYTTDQSNKSDGFGYFGQYSGSFFNDHLSVLYGWRKDQTGSSTINRFNHTVSNPADLNTHVPRYSVTYKPIDWLSIYYLHTEQADPTVTSNKYSNITPSAGAVGWANNDPRLQETLSSAVVAELDEIGVKGSFMEGKITASFAMFELKRDGFILNIFTSEPSSNGVGSVSFNKNYIANGENVRGFEFEVFGQLAQRLTLNASISSMDGSKLAPDGSVIPIEALIDSATINLKYDFRDERRNGFELTGGAKLMFKGWTMVPGTYETFHGDQYYIDAGLNYHWKGGRYTATVRCNNITNNFIFISGNSQLPLRRSYASFSVNF
jgi:outer membrane receptor protein involved in Fe transport